MYELKQGKAKKQEPEKETKTAYGCADRTVAKRIKAHGRRTKGGVGQIPDKGTAEDVGRIV